MCEFHQNDYKQMKVLHITSSDQNGAGLAAIRIHSSLLSNGIDSKVLCATKKSTRNEVVEYKQPLKNKVIQFFFRVFRKMGLELNPVSRMNNRITKLLKGDAVFYTLPISNYDLSTHPLVQEADIIHLHWVANFLDYPSFFVKVQKPIVWTLHDEGLYYGIFHYKRNVEQYQQKLLCIENECRDIKLKALEHVESLTIVALSTMMYDNSIKQAIVANRRHVKIHNSVNPHLYKPYDKTKAKAELGIDLTKKVLFFVCDGISDPRKGIKELIQAIELMEHEQITLVAVGGESINFDTNIDIRFLGYIRDEEKLSKAYSAADLFVLPSFQEAFAQTPLEAMACGVPVVMFPCSGSTDLINETNGIIAADFTVEALKEAIDKAVNQKFDALKVRQTILNQFTPSEISEQYICVYNSILDINSI